MESFQVSNQCMALVREKTLVPLKGAPADQAYVIESSEKQYVPNVFFTILQGFYILSQTLTPLSFHFHNTKSTSSTPRPMSRTPCLRTE